MTPDQWALQHNISREPVEGVDPMDRIKWGMQILKGTVTTVHNYTWDDVANFKRIGKEFGYAHTTRQS